MEGGAGLKVLIDGHWEGRRYERGTGCCKAKLQGVEICLSERRL